MGLAPLNLNIQPVTENTLDAVKKRLNEQISRVDEAYRLLRADTEAVGLAVGIDTLYVDSENNRIGIGISSPIFTLHTQGTSGSEGAFFDAIGTSSAPNVMGRRARGTITDKTKALTGDALMILGGRAHTGIDYTTSSVSAIKFIAEQDFSTTDYGTRIEFDTTAPGGTTKTTKVTIKGDGRVGIGTNSPATSAAVDITSTTGALLMPRMTTAQRNALTAVNGMIIFNTTDNKFQGYAGSWVDLH